ncbi:MAG: hypothetical protein Q8Q02_11305 [Nocardioides sp.]|nr:hypothetical protein [Nocardioides sp.]
MSRTISRTLALGVASAALLVASGGAASAAPACGGTVAGALHMVHDTTGDPGGLVHEVEETYCSVG